METEEIVSSSDSETSVQLGGSEISFSSCWVGGGVAEDDESEDTLLSSDEEVVLAPSSYPLGSSVQLGGGEISIGPLSSALIPSGLCSQLRV